jgi:tRNA (guanine37-N1)-methyltransferase
MASPLKSLCVIVPKAEGENVRKKLLETDNFRKDLIVGRDGENLLFPILKSVDLGFEIKEIEFEEAGVAVRSYIDIVEVPEELESLLPTAFDVIGEIAVIKIPDELKEYSSAVGSAILEANKPVVTVVSDEGVTGDYRVRNIKVIAGEDSTKTYHTEYGMKFAVDLAKAYFSPRLATERQRVTRMVKEGELIIDMFCGVGPFSVTISKNVPGSKIFGIDSNPYAIKNFMENIRINKVENVIPMEGDVKELMPSMEPADRIIMDLPQNSFDFFELALSSLKEGGTIHYYETLTEVEAREREDDLISIVQKQGRKMELEERRVVHGYSPTQNHYVFDIKVC